MENFYLKLGGKPPFLLAMLVTAFYYFGIRNNIGISIFLFILLALHYFSVHFFIHKANFKNNKFPTGFMIISYSITTLFVFSTIYTGFSSGWGLIGGFWLVGGFFVYGFILKAWGMNDIFVMNYDDRTITSYLNPMSIIRGFKWTSFEDLQSKLKEGIYIDNFQIIENIDKFKTEKLAEISKIDLKILALNFTKTILAIGKAGSGKTEFFMNISSQNENFNHFKRELYHDVKGDFVEKLYQSETDFILNPYDSRGLVWDLWEDMKHNEALVVSFIQNLIVSQVKESDFWTTSASKLLSDSIMRVHFTFGNKLTSAEKWEKLLSLLDEYKSSIENDKTKQSIWQTLELGLEYINLLAYQTKMASKQNLFSIYNWCNADNSRLFLLNNASYSKKLNPYFTGFLACVIEVLLSKPDTKTDLTLLLLDEYLSLKLDENVRLKLMTQIRSKGGCCVLGVQYLDANDKKQKQLIGSSTFAKVLFNVADDETVETFVKAYGTVEWEKEKVSNSFSKSRRESSSSESVSIEDKSTNFITHEMIKGLSNFRHITFIDELGIYYVGYTRQSNLIKMNSHFVKRDLQDFYGWLYNREHTPVESSSSNDEILEVEQIDDTAKLLAKDFTERLTIYTDLRECINNNDTEQMQKIISKYGLENVDIDKFIDDFES